MFSLLDKLAKLRKANKMKVLFYKDAHGFGSHGMLNVSNKSLGLRHDDISFVIAGVTVPPHLSVDVFATIMEEATHQGYTPHHVSFYGVTTPVVIPSGANLSEHLARLAQSGNKIAMPSAMIQTVLDTSRQQQSHRLPASASKMMKNWGGFSDNHQTTNAPAPPVPPTRPKLQTSEENFG